MNTFNQYSGFKYELYSGRTNSSGLDERSNRDRRSSRINPYARKPKPVEENQESDIHEDTAVSSDTVKPNDIKSCGRARFQNPHRKFKSRFVQHRNLRLNRKPKSRPIRPIRYVNLDADGDIQMPDAPPLGKLVRFADELDIKIRETPRAKQKKSVRFADGFDTQLRKTPILVRYIPFDDGVGTMVLENPPLGGRVVYDPNVGTLRTGAPPRVDGYVPEDNYVSDDRHEPFDDGLDTEMPDAPPLDEDEPTDDGLGSAASGALSDGQAAPADDGSDFGLSYPSS